MHVLLSVPREVREALVALEYCDDFPLPTAHSAKGEAKDVSGAAYTKTFNLGAGASTHILAPTSTRCTFCFAACRRALLRCSGDVRRC